MASLALALAATLAASSARADEIAPAYTDGPSGGLLVEGRVVTSPATLGLATGLAPVTIGYRAPGGDGGGGQGAWGISVGPIVAVSEQDDGAFSAPRDAFGAAVVIEHGVVASASTRTEGYVLVGASLVVSKAVAIGGCAGLGARYWLAPHLALGAELALAVNYGAFDHTYALAGSERTAEEGARARLGSLGDLAIALTF